MFTSHMSLEIWHTAVECLITTLSLSETLLSRRQLRIFLGHLLHLGHAQASKLLLVSVDEIGDAFWETERGRVMRDSLDNHPFDKCAPHRCAPSLPCLMYVWQARQCYCEAISAVDWNAARARPVLERSP